MHGLPNLKTTMVGYVCGPQPAMCRSTAVFGMLCWWCDFRHGQVQKMVFLYLTPSSKYILTFQRK